MRTFALIGILFLLSFCKSIKLDNKVAQKEANVSFWNHKCDEQDSVYGISLDKWYAENTKKTNQGIIVATIDSQIDLDHEDLQGKFWVNKNEIPDNGIDDDNNGYIDDINGWNFIGIDDEKTLAFCNFEFVRYINVYKQKYEKEKIENKNKYFLEEYERALKKYKSENKYYSTYLKVDNMLISAYYPAKDSLRRYFPKEDYTIEKLDSLYQIHKENDKSLKQRLKENNESKKLGDLIFYMKTIKEFEYTIESMKKSQAHNDSIVNKLLNFGYDDRIKIKNYQLEKGYGNNNLNSHHRLRRHNTEVASIIAANRNNTIGVKGFHNNIKIMPLNISPFGNEHDKDIANAIYYAVDNGAKVINMSFSKEFSLDQHSVTKALNYAQKNNVLVVHVSGNGATDIDENPFYPSDFDYENKQEIVGNLITVGSISKRRDSTMIPFSSNYGKNNVDLFAPGEDIYVAVPDNQYDFYSGTSLAAPMVSGTAALIWLYYPNLTVQEVKNIILESGVTIDKMVIKPGTENEMVHFSELCKTGRVLNTYNAMKMAAEVSKKKK
ncbi:MULTISPECIES: S8 family serine peptidase [Flavobacterium]|uniref:S8 family serine peptidase n=1 Tax=Flavobacterium jumunjinense TaxID=998845 RepID=A0ABV5GQC7_9FLAO|nr:MULTISPECIES: S8 family serine peptidase [Flavobacterium]